MGEGTSGKSDVYNRIIEIGCDMHVSDKSGGQERQGALGEIED